MTIVKYTPSLDKLIRNTDQLPRGLGCKFLLCIRCSHRPGEYIAKAWKRKAPATIGPNEVLIAF